MPSQMYLEPVVRHGKVEGPFRLVRLRSSKRCNNADVLTPIQGFALAVAASAVLWMIIAAIWRAL